MEATRHHRIVTRGASVIVTGPGEGGRPHVADRSIKQLQGISDGLAQRALGLLEGILESGARVEDVAGDAGEPGAARGHWYGWFGAGRPWTQRQHGRLPSRPPNGATSLVGERGFRH
jgi:hypothetical protein